MAINKDSIPWGKLVAQGRAKGYNTPWTEPEIVAITTQEDSVKKEALITALRAGVSLEEALEQINKPSSDKQKEVLESVETVEPNVLTPEEETPAEQEEEVKSIIADKSKKKSKSKK